MYIKQLCVSISVVFSCLVSITSGDAQMKGAANWSEGILTAPGFGAPRPGVSKAQAKILAATAARMDAYRNLLVILKGVHITSERTVEDTLVTSDKITGKVEGIIRGAWQIGETTYDDDGSARLTMAIGLWGPMLDRLLPKTGFGTKASLLDPSIERPVAEVTGLIVDASGLSVTPALAPRVVDEDKALVYGAEFVDREAAVAISLVGYETDMVSARKNGRAGKNPLVVKGKEVTGPSSSNLSISSMDGVRIRVAASKSTFLNQCKVVFVTGE
jgi:hypothetical protein